MSQTMSPDPDEEAKEAIEENRELFERVAEADVSISDRIQEMLEAVDGGDE